MEKGILSPFFRNFLIIMNLMLILFILFVFILFLRRHVFFGREGFQETVKTLPEMKYDFNDNNHGYFQIGTFLMQWGLAQGGAAGKNVKSKGQNPVMAWGLGVVVGITLDMMEDREAWDAGVSMNIDFDEIYGAHVIPYGDKDRVIYENIKVKELSPSRIVVRASNYHAPFLWFAYGMRVRGDNSDEDDGNSKLSGNVLENEVNALNNTNN